MRLLLILALLIAIPPLILRFRPRWAAAFNLVVTNRILGPLAVWLPGFGVLTHTGRKSGRHFRTPIKVFPTPGGFLIALTYGPNSQWVQNVLAAGGAELETRRTHYHLSNPVVVHDPTRRNFPLHIRVALRILGATDFLRATSSQ